MSLEQRALVLDPVDAPKSWGGELWLNATRPEGPATLAGSPGVLLAEVLSKQPALLGRWARALFGDEQPIFTKLVQSDFPPLVHLGFRKAVPRGELLGWLEREQALLGELHRWLVIGTRSGFDGFSAAYSAWAAAQAVDRWRREDEGSLAERLAPFVRAGEAEGLRDRLVQLRLNRARIVEVLNEIDLRHERGNLLLSSAGVVHSIFGLSHQTHPIDRSRPALEALLARLRHMAAAGKSDDELAAEIDAAGLPALRGTNPAPPKNEAWIPAEASGRLLLVEPQQTSDTTRSLADFFTPFVWADERVRFRKGDAGRGLQSQELEASLAGMDLAPMAVERFRRVPELVASGPSARLYRLVDEPAAWPFFTAYRLDLAGEPSAPARFRTGHPAGVFQHLVPLEGTVQLRDQGGATALGPRATAFIPATHAGGYELSATCAATVFIFSVPGARGGGPRID